MSNFELGCRDLGGMDCNFVAKGNTVEEVKKNLYKHAGEEHKDVLALMPEDKMKEMDSLMDKLLANQK